MQGPIEIDAAKPDNHDPANCPNACNELLQIAFRYYAARQYPHAFSPGSSGEAYMHGNGISMRDVLGVVLSVRGAAHRNLKCWDEDYLPHVAPAPAPPPPVPWQASARPSPNLFSSSREAPGFGGRRIRWGQSRRDFAGGATEVVRVTLPPAGHSAQRPQPSALERVCLAVTGKHAEV